MDFERGAWDFAQKDAELFFQGPQASKTEGRLRCADGDLKKRPRPAVGQKFREFHRKKYLHEFLPQPREDQAIPKALQQRRHFHQRDWEQLQAPTFQAIQAILPNLRAILLFLPQTP